MRVKILTAILLFVVLVTSSAASFWYGTQFTFLLEKRSEQVEVSQAPQDWGSVVSEEKIQPIGE